MDLGLKNKVIVVTGGSSGIGEAVVRSFAAEGAVPVILDRDREGAEKILSEIGSGSFEEVELTDEVSIQKAIEVCLAEHHKIDGVINNAGVNDSVGLDSPTSAFVASLEKNLVPAFCLIQKCLPALKKTQGAIINIGSKVARTGQGGTSGYAASKGGLNALTREWALDLAPDGIRVNCVVPAEVMTPMYERWIQSREEPEAALAEIGSRIPLGQRFTEPQEIADLVVFLASERSLHTTGQILHVDGGYVHLDRAIPIHEQ